MTTEETKGMTLHEADTFRTMLDNYFEDRTYRAQGGVVENGVTFRTLLAYVDGLLVARASESVIDKPVNAANQVVFEGHTFTKPHASLLQIVRRHDGSLGVLCRKRNVFDEFREFRGDGQFEQIQDWLDELIEDHDEIVGESEVSRLERRYGPNWQENHPELWKRGEH